MINFFIYVILVFIGVDLLVRFILEPLILGSFKKKKVLRTSTSKLDSEFRLATETLYDGGEPHSPDLSSNSTNEKNMLKDEANE